MTGDNVNSRLILKSKIAELDCIIAGLQKRRLKLSDELKALDGPDHALIETREAYSPEFEELWKIYPSRNGIKVEKRAAYLRFKKIKTHELSHLKKAIENYAASDEARRGIVRDMMRFLKDDFWPQWINKTPDTFTDGKTAKELAKEMLKNAR